MEFDSKRLSHAYITSGDTVNRLSMAVVCSARDDSDRPCMKCSHCDKTKRSIHPDIIIISRLEDKKEILIDQIREIKKDVYIKPNEAEQKVYIIHYADTMNQNAQNAFLQMLEEPPAHAVFILSTSNPASLLPTVRSRCVDLKTQTGSIGEFADDFEAMDSDVSTDADIKALASEFVAAVNDNLILAKLMFRLDKLNRLAFSSFIDYTRAQIVSALRADPHEKKLLSADEVLMKATEMLSLNVSAGHISGFLCASFIE